MALVRTSYVAGQLFGTSTNDAAAAGRVGELLSASLAIGDATSLTTGTPKTVISREFTAGDWDIRGIGGFVVDTSTVLTLQVISLSLVTDTLDGTLGRQIAHRAAAGTVPAGSSIFGIPPTSFQFASPTTVYLVLRADFSVSTVAGYGLIQGRRMR